MRSDRYRRRYGLVARTSWYRHFVGSRHYGAMDPVFSSHHHKACSSVCWVNNDARKHLYSPRRKRRPALVFLALLEPVPVGL